MHQEDLLLDNDSFRKKKISSEKLRFPNPLCGIQILTGPFLAIPYFTARECSYFSLKKHNTFDYWLFPQTSPMLFELYTIFYC